VEVLTGSEGPVFVRVYGIRNYNNIKTGNYIFTSKELLRVAHAKIECEKMQGFAIPITI
jgi:hypothetical protein